MHITIYSTSTCGICHALMKWLDARGKAYEEVIVDTDPAGMVRLMEASHGALGVPFTVIDTDNGTQVKIGGFDRKRLEALLA